MSSSQTKPKTATGNQLIGLETVSVVGGAGVATAFMRIRGPIQQVMSRNSRPKAWLAGCWAEKLPRFLWLRSHARTLTLRPGIESFC